MKTIITKTLLTLCALFALSSLIRSFTSNHLCIDVNDLYYGSRYTLTLSRW